MKLLLTSAGITNKSIEKALLDLLGKPFSKSKIVFIPTAANVESGGKEWLIEDMNRFRLLGFEQVDIVDLAAIPKEIWEPQLTGADVIVFGGGNDFYLIDWIEKSGLGSMLPELLKTRVYVGISAGSCVAGKLSIEASKIIYNEDPRYLTDAPGLEFVNLVFLPHLNSKWFPKVSKEYVKEFSAAERNPVCALDDQSALKVAEGKIDVISEGEFLTLNV